MAVTVDYQAWDSASYNWLDKTTSTAAPQQINDKITAWITAVNANAANTNKQVTLEKGPADSTSTNFIGWTLKFDSNSSGSPFWVKLHTTTTTNIACYFGTTWTNDGSSGGYGLTGGTTGSDTSNTYAVSGVAGEFVVAAETANGEEFLALGYRIGSDAAKSACLLIFKDTNNEWAAVWNISSSQTGTLYMAEHTTPARTMSVAFDGNTISDNASYLTSLQLWVTSGFPATGNAFTAMVGAKSDALYQTSLTANRAFGRYATMADSSKVICLGNCSIYVRY